jgi:hypothetical protein
MADDSGLLEFTLDKNDTSPPNLAPNPSASNATNSAATPITASAHIESVVANLIRHHFFESATFLIEHYWKSYLVQCESQHGVDSPIWRKAVKKLSNLALFLDPDTVKHYPQVNATLLPALLTEMKHTLQENQLDDDRLESVLASVQTKSPLPSLLTQASSPAPVASPATNEIEFSSIQQDTAVEEEVPSASLEFDTAIPETDLDIDSEASLSFDLDEVDDELDLTDALTLDLSEEFDEAPTSIAQPEVKESPKPMTASLDDDELPPLELDFDPFDTDKK